MPFFPVGGGSVDGRLGHEQAGHPIPTQATLGIHALQWVFVPRLESLVNPESEMPT